MLRTKLFRGFAMIVVLFSLLSAVIGVRTINRRVMEEAQKRVSFDLSSAWSVYDGQLAEIETIMKLVANKNAVVDACAARAFDDQDLLNRLERIRVNFELDYLSLVRPDGQVVLRTTPPYATGDSRISDPAVKRALGGDSTARTALLSQKELETEADGLADKAFMELKETPKARLLRKTVETRGMVMEAAVPVMTGSQVVGVVYGGVLINRNHALVDRIHDVVYRKEKYMGRSLGTATIFLGDTRISTSVRERNGNRAIATRVSKEVAERVLDNATPWVDEAFVVRDWFLSAYEPIRDGNGQVIGMLYVGILKAPFDRDARTLAYRYILLTVFVLLVGLVLAFLTAGRLSAPIHRLVEASHQMRKGQRPGLVPTDNACHETEELIEAFNQMSSTLAEREENLVALNRSYMETLGFVSHELKSPVATIMNYTFLLRERKLGELTERQVKAIRAIDSGSQRLVEMVRHYLNLSRIENGELDPVRTRVHVLEDVLNPLIEQVESTLNEKKMTLVNEVAPGICLHADMNMVREVFENMVSNAIKYGFEGGNILVAAEPVNGEVAFRVRNDGEGIPADKLGQLFQKFSRLEGMRSVKREKGTGLGLFITKHIVDAHGGTISVDSVAGEWAEFRFTLPRCKEESE